MPTLGGYAVQSIAKLCGKSALALIMTGMGVDGLEGSREIHAAGGTVLAQDEATSAVWGMPGQVAAQASLRSRSHWGNRRVS